MKKLVEQARSILTNYVDKEHKGVRSRAAKALGIANVTLSQWLDGVRVPNLENLSPVFEQLGIDFSTPKTDAGKDSEDMRSCRRKLKTEYLRRHQTLSGI